MKNTKKREPSLFRQIVAIHYEQAKRRKALRILEKQEWSVDFLSMLIVRSAKMYGSPLTMEIVSKGGHKLVLSSVRSDNMVQDPEDSIFNKLDDKAAVEKFILEHSRR